MTVPQAFQIALQRHQAGQLAEAEALYRQILAAQPDHANAVHFIGVLSHQLGRHHDALEWLHKAVALDPRNPIVLCHLGETCRAIGRLDEAVSHFRRALAIDPNYAIGCYNLGNALQNQGLVEDSIVAYRRALQLKPHYLEAHNNLGNALKDRGRLNEAIAAYRGALEINPNSPLIHANLGNAQREQGHLDEAIASQRRALKLNPNFPEAHNNLGNALWEMGQFDEAIAAHRRALQFKPDYPEALNDLGNALTGRGRFDEAIAAFRDALQRKPRYPEACNNLGNALRQLLQFDEAVTACRRALELNPGYARAHATLGATHAGQGAMDEAIASFRRALELDPADARTHSDLIYTLHFHPDHNARTIAEERRRWNRQFGNPPNQPAAPTGPYANDPSPGRPLRIGYVSPDFRSHVVGRNLIPLFEHHDPREFEIFCYAGVVRPDQLTEQFRRRAHHWRSTVGLRDEALASMIQRDGVDILVDLTQHMAGNRLPLFARRPAPVHVSFAGYPESTGLEAIGCRISDRFLEAGCASSPVAGLSEAGVAGLSEAGVAGLSEAGVAGLSEAGVAGLSEAGVAGLSEAGVAGLSEAGLGAAADQRASNEHVHLIDTFWCYDPDDGDTQITPLPASENGRITFGCLNNFCKVNEPTLRLWARVLGKAADSRLVLMAGPGSHRQRTLEALGREGVAAHRVEFQEYRPRREYLESYHRLDIVLDTAPYNGHTTSLDALWMGVPVVSLAGETPVSRAGLSQLTNLGQPELAAGSEEHFVKIAIELAANLPRLAELRATLRARMQASPLMDAPRFARSIEAAYRSMWQAWLRRD